MRFACFLMCVAFSFFYAAAQKRDDPAASLQKKLDYLQKNAARRAPDTTPTILTEQEVNAYIASGRVQLPQGVKSVRLSSRPGVITGKARIDFDEIKSGRGSLNPLLAVFSGAHDVVVVAHARGTSRKGIVQVDSVTLDDVEIPRFVLQLFVDKYLKPKYPELGLNSEFVLPERIDSAVVGEHAVTVVQK